MSDYTVGSFNIQHLNYTKDFEKLAEIIKTEGFDVNAITPDNYRFIKALLQGIMNIYFCIMCCTNIVTTKLEYLLLS